MISKIIGEIMKINIKDIMYYGRHYTDITSEPYWWFGKDDYQIYSSESLIKEYSYKDTDDILQSEYFIPLFQTDIIELEKEFLAEYNSRPLQDKTEKLVTQANGNFDLAFKTLIEVEEGMSENWYGFERKKLYNDAVNWCQKHNIKYQ